MMPEEVLGVSLGIEEVGKNYTSDKKYILSAVVYNRLKYNPTDDYDALNHLIQYFETAITDYTEVEVNELLSVVEERLSEAFREREPGDINDDCVRVYLFREEVVDLKINFKSLRAALVKWGVLQNLEIDKQLLELKLLKSYLQDHPELYEVCALDVNRLKFGLPPDKIIPMVPPVIVPPPEIITEVKDSISDTEVDTDVTFLDFEAMELERDNGLIFQLLDQSINVPETSVMKEGEVPCAPPVEFFPKKEKPPAPLTITQSRDERVAGTVKRPVITRAAPPPPNIHARAPKAHSCRH